jgi:hypothetical protein
VRLVGIEAFTQARDRLLEVIEAEADTVAALDATSFALHAVTGFSSSAIMPVDPKTLLPTGGVVEGFDVDACAPFWDGELLAPGFNKFTALARSTDPVGTLVEATDGDLRRAPLYLNLYEGMGVGDELRVAFIVGTTCWAWPCCCGQPSSGRSPTRRSTTSGGSPRSSAAPCGSVPASWRRPSPGRRP